MCFAARDFAEARTCSSIMTKERLVRTVAAERGNRMLKHDEPAIANSAMWDKVMRSRAGICCDKVVEHGVK